MMRAILYVVIAALLPVSAFAHAFLERADPPVGSEVSTPPRQLVLIFTEGVEPLFTTVQIRDPSGKNVPTGKPQREPGD